MRAVRCLTLDMASLPFAGQPLPHGRGAVRGFVPSRECKRAGARSLTTLCLMILLLAVSALAQTATLRGRVLDESGAVVPGAKVALAGPAEFAGTATSSADGSYSFRDLPPGNYTVQASAPDLALLEPLK